MADAFEMVELPWLFRKAVAVLNVLEVGGRVGWLLLGGCCCTYHMSLPLPDHVAAGAACFPGGAVCFPAGAICLGSGAV